MSTLGMVYAYNSHEGYKLKFWGKFDSILANFKCMYPLIQHLSLSMILKKCFLAFVQKNCLLKTKY